ncbi:hypothetical protein ACFV3R_16980 [Streptomyces sp. NPDC059740]|uniref:hypothetical protein n=1 Tax=Streptomyces sp. NPDC059740 TaxID=3346926 RepID=UPI00365649F0
MTEHFDSTPAVPGADGTGGPPSTGRAPSRSADGPPYPGHLVPPGVSDTTVEALGVLSEALETTERARGHLYAFHQLTGGADWRLDEAVRLLREAGHEPHARLVERKLVGRDVIPQHWTYQIVEAYEDTYYRVFREVEEQVRQDLAAGRRHLYEARMQARRRPEPEAG